MCPGAKTLGTGGLGLGPWAWLGEFGALEIRSGVINNRTIQKWVLEPGSWGASHAELGGQGLKHIFLIIFKVNVW